MAYAQDTPGTLSIKPFPHATHKRNLNSSAHLPMDIERSDIEPWQLAVRPSQSEHITRMQSVVVANEETHDSEDEDYRSRLQDDRWKPRTRLPASRAILHTLGSLISEYMAMSSLA